MPQIMPENHKGTWCWLSPNKFCQEGYCSVCQIYLDAVGKPNFKKVKKREEIGVLEVAHPAATFGVATTEISIKMG